jgi:hypothetical protein
MKLRARQICHREKHGHNLRKKQQAIKNRTDTPTHFHQRIQYNANRTNLCAGRRQTPLLHFLATDLSRSLINETWRQWCQVDLLRLIDPTESSNIASVRYLVQGKSTDHNSSKPRFPSTVSRRIKTYEALFPCWTQVQVPERLPIYWIVTLFAWNRNISSLWIRPSHYGHRKAVHTSDSAREHQRG